LRILAHLFNSLPAGSPGCFHALVALIRFVAEINSLDTIVRQLPRLDEWFDEWNSTIEDKRTMYQTIHESCKKCGKSDLAMQYNIKYLETFNSSAVIDETVREYGRQCIVDSVAAPSVYQLDTLTSLNAIKCLKDEPAGKLLDVFATGMLGDYQAFHASNSSFLTQRGLSHDDNVRKMRLLTLSSMPRTNHTIPYADIAEALDIAPEAVEEWVIEALSAGLLNARLDQLSQCLNVRSSMQRTFTRTEWEVLHTRLCGWQDNVREILRVVRETKGQMPVQ